MVGVSIEKRANYIEGDREIGSERDSEKDVKIERGREKKRDRKIKRYGSINKEVGGGWGDKSRL